LPVVAFLSIMQEDYYTLRMIRVGFIITGITHSVVVGGDDVVVVAVVVADLEEDFTKSS
jgi:hypothetical protein